MAGHRKDARYPAHIPATAIAMTRPHSTVLPAIAVTLLLGACNANLSAPQAASPQASAKPATSSDADLLARGEYLVRITGCNDCHTAGYTEKAGDLPTSAWLLGSPLGYSGPWGTTYAANLRLRLAEMDEAEWMTFSATLRTRPIMPDFALRAMHDDDRRAIYRFIRSLGTGGTKAPEYLPPGSAPPAPFFQLVLPPAPPANPPAGG
jgi:mono/diheme cytochrome c family protein